MATQLSDLVVEVNNDQIGIVANTLDFDEGLGEQTVRAVSEGNGKVSQVYANDVENSFATVTFSIHSTIDNIELAKSWKQGRNGNVVTLSGKDAEGNDIQRAFTQCALVTNYKVMISADGNIDLEFHGNAPT